MSSHCEGRVRALEHKIAPLPLQIGTMIIAQRKSRGHLSTLLTYLSIDCLQINCKICVKFISCFLRNYFAVSLPV